MSTGFLFATSSNSIPSISESGYLEITNRIRLRYALFRKPSRNTHGTILIAQGRNEYIEKYYETAATFSAVGFDVAAFDWRGQGGSSRLISNRRVGHITSINDYIEDILAIVKLLKDSDLQDPIFIVAHSMGALVTLTAEKALSQHVAGAAIIAPFLGMPDTSLTRRFARHVSALACAFGKGEKPVSKDVEEQGFDENDLTSDPTRFMRNMDFIKQFPDLSLGPPSWRWLKEMLSAGSRLMDKHEIVSTVMPLLFFATKRDRVVSFSDTLALSSRIKSSRFVSIENSQHEILQETDAIQTQFYSHAIPFLMEKAKHP